MIFARTRNQYLADQFARQRKATAKPNPRRNHSRRPLVRFDYAVGKEGMLFARGNVSALTKSEARSIIKRRYNVKTTAGIVKWIKAAA